MLTIRNLVFAAALAGGAAGGAGCTGEVAYSSGYYGGYDYGAPDLVEISPGVQVIADYDEPVFYSDNFYWRHSGGIWYRSGSWGGGWARYDRPPVGIARIDHPGRYAHYRPYGWQPHGHGNVARREYGHDYHRESGHVEHRESRPVEHRESRPVEHRESRPPQAAHPHTSGTPQHGRH